MSLRSGRERMRPAEPDSDAETDREVPEPVANQLPGSAGSPNRKRQRVYGDRFIPTRQGQDLRANYTLLDDHEAASSSKGRRRIPNGELHFQRSAHIASIVYFTPIPHMPLLCSVFSVPQISYTSYVIATLCVFRASDPYTLYVIATLCVFRASDPYTSYTIAMLRVFPTTSYAIAMVYMSLSSQSHVFVLTPAEEANRTFTNLLRTEIFDAPDEVFEDSHPRTRSSVGGRPRTPPSEPSRPSFHPASLTPSTPHKNLFSYRSPKHHSSSHLTPSRTPGGRRSLNLDTTSELYSLSPVRVSSQRLLLTPRRSPRAVSKVPFKVLDAPDLADDFYLNLVDWGSSNVLGVGLHSCVFMWNSGSGKVNKLCDLQDDIVTSVSWIQRGTHLAIGTNKGTVQIWDAEKQRRLRTMSGHSARVGALAWNDHILTSGSRDRLIYHRDVRQPDQWMRRLIGHKQEVCGLKWNSEDGQLASGGNDNKLMVWDKLSDAPLWKFTDHSAAVKAIAWSPHQHHLLASGGGTADRRIKFRDTLTGKCISELDTGSQVCNLVWSKNSNELVSTHGYSQNQIVVWKYPSMTQVASLTGHTYRVLYLAMSPDGQSVVTGAGDETLRFWKCFHKREREGIGGPSGSLKLHDTETIR